MKIPSVKLDLDSRRRADEFTNHCADNPDDIETLIFHYVGLLQANESVLRLLLHPPVGVLLEYESWYRQLLEAMEAPHDPS